MTEKISPQDPARELRKEIAALRKENAELKIKVRLLAQDLQGIKA